MQYSKVLAIAGSDSGGGAGIQADIKSISATGSYAASAITAVTVQNTLGVLDVFPVPVEIIKGQIKAVLSDIGADAVKIGMLHNSEVILGVKESLLEFGVKNLVLDPVMVSTSGHRLIEESAVKVLAKELIPMASIITPNIPEAEILASESIRSVNDLPRIAEKLSLGGTISVMMKGGHLEDGDAEDILYDAQKGKRITISSPRVRTVNTHGTGCTLSSAIASYLAQGNGIEEAVRQAKEYIYQAILSGSQYAIGHGHGPVNHFWNR